MSSNVNDEGVQIDLNAPDIMNTLNTMNTNNQGERPSSRGSRGGAQEESDELLFQVLGHNLTSSSEAQTSSSGLASTSTALTSNQ